MKKETFIDYVEKVKDYIKKEQAVDDALRALSPDFGGFCMGDAISDIIDLLEMCMGDESNWLSYYVWETDCGTNSCADSVSEDGKRIPFRTIEDVYNLMASEEKKDDTIHNYLIEELNKYKKLYENEKDHSDTLQKIIDKMTDNVIDAVIPEEAKEAKSKTTVGELTIGDSELTLDELLETITDELLKEFGKNE